MKKFQIHPIIFYAIIILFLELFIKATICKHIFNNGLLYLLVFSIPIILILSLFSKLFNHKINKIFLFINTSILVVYFEVQLIFYKLFSLPFSFSTIGLADQALDFTSIIKDAIIDFWPQFICILLPLILLIIFHKYIDTEQNSKKASLITLLIVLASYGVSFLTLIPGKKSYNSAYKLYYNVDDQISIIDKFGMLTYTKIDIKRQIFGYENELIIDNSGEFLPSADNPNSEPTEIIYGDNITEIDFASKDSKNETIKSLNNYFASTPASGQSKYTGMFKGKNLIFILAEGFNEVAVDENRTPTLYKLVNNGFVFNNFYSPVFLSTTGGEFQATTGLIPTQETLKLWKSEKPTISYGLGNSFKNIGYRAQSFHDWTYTYYKRNKTMLTLGFDNYTGCGNGLEKEMRCSWLPFDTDMINVTTPDYLGKEGNFVTYYVTVSGHSPYTKGGNVIKKYYEYLNDKEYSTIVKSYLASQMELDRMLETLISKLEESGELDDTVIALVGDHYPYTLSTDEMNEMSDYKKDGIVEVNRSNFILWNNTMEEPIEINKVGSQIDVLPTLLNLFGIEYDSRLIIGKDILSDYEGLAIFSNRSWVSDYGTYNASSKKFTIKEGMHLDDVNAYVSRINNRVSNAFSISKMIIDSDYYKYILEK